MKTLWKKLLNFEHHQSSCLNFTPAEAMKANDALTRPGICWPFLRLQRIIDLKAISNFAHPERTWLTQNKISYSSAFIIVSLATTIIEMKLSQMS